MKHAITKALAAATLALAGAAAHAAAVEYAGNLGDTGNAYLVGSGDPLGAPDFSTPENNTALYQLHVTQDGTLTFTSTSYSDNHLDVYLSLFSGSGNSAVFVGSAQDDIDWSMHVSAGWYWVAIGDFENFSFAENTGSGTLGDGFIGIGDPNWYRDGAYDVIATLDTGTPPVPEPSQPALLMLGLVAFAVRSWRARARA